VTARVISIPRGNPNPRAIECTLGGDKLVADLGVDAMDERHYYIAMPREAAPLASVVAELVARAINAEE